MIRTPFKLRDQRKLAAHLRWARPLRAVCRAAKHSDVSALEARSRDAFALAAGLKLVAAYIRGLGL